MLCLIQMMRRTTVIGVDLAVGLKIPPSCKIDVCVIKLIIPPSIKCKSLRHLKNKELLKLKQEKLLKRICNQQSLLFI